MAKIRTNCIAIDLGATNTRAALIDETGKILEKESGLTPHEGENQVLIESILSIIGRLIDKDELREVAGAGICVPGFIDKDNGLLVQPPNLPYKNVPIVKELEASLKIPIIINNDANAAAIGEKHWGWGENANNFAYVTLSSGIGGAIYMSGKLVTDERGNSIEIGHVEIDSEYDLPCGCGGRNHWESYTSGMNMPNFLAAWAKKNKVILDFDGSTVFTIFDAIEKKNEIAVKFFEQLMEINLAGINILIKKYQPELIIIGGSVFLHHQPLFYQYFPDKSLVKAAFFGDDACLIGTAASVFSYK